MIRTGKLIAWKHARSVWEPALQASTFSRGCEVRLSSPFKEAVRLDRLIIVNREEHGDGMIS